MRTCFIIIVHSTAQRYLELVSGDVERPSVREAARLSASERSVLQRVLCDGQRAGRRPAQGVLVARRRNCQILKTVKIKLQFIGGVAW